MNWRARMRLKSAGVTFTPQPLAIRLSAFPPSYLPEPSGPLPTEIVAAPVEAWRAWNVVEVLLPTGPEAIRRMADAFDAGRNPFRELIGPFLTAVSTGSVWLGGEAVCPQVTHKAPDASCTCGYWAVRDRAQAEQVAADYLAAPVYGRVLMWGRIVEHRYGYRAQFAKPVELFVYGDQALADRLAARYGVPATMVEPPPVDAYQEALANLQAMNAARAAMVKAIALQRLGPQKP